MHINFIISHNFTPRSFSHGHPWPSMAIHGHIWPSVALSASGEHEEMTQKLEEMGLQELTALNSWQLTQRRPTQWTKLNFLNLGRWRRQRKSATKLKRLLRHRHFVMFGDPSHSLHISHDSSILFISSLSLQTQHRSSSSLKHKDNQDVQNLDEAHETPPSQPKPIGSYRLLMAGGIPCPSHPLTSLRTTRRQQSFEHEADPTQVPREKGVIMIHDISLCTLWKTMIWYIHTHIYTHTHIYIYIYICVCILIHVIDTCLSNNLMHPAVYVYIYTHTQYIYIYIYILHIYVI